MKKRVRCMADGGIVETPEQMMARMNAKYGLGGAGTSPTPPKPADKQQPPAQPQRPSPVSLTRKRHGRTTASRDSTRTATVSEPSALGVRLTVTASCLCLGPRRWQACGRDSRRSYSRPAVGIP